MSEFKKRFTKALHVNFSRVKTEKKSVVEYRTYFGTALPTTRYISTKVDEDAAAADGVDTLEIVDQIKVHHYNEIMQYIDNELRKALKLKGE